MSSSPGRVMAVLDNRLPTPRHVSVQLSPDYTVLKAQVWQLVEGEMAPRQVSRSQRA